MDRFRDRFLTDYLECFTISVTPEITSNTAFYHPREGYLIVIKDDVKRSYFLELYHSIKSDKFPQEQKSKPAVRLEVKFKKSLFLNK
jgi:hypothetical protein